jgi:hypothetical protein
VLAFAAVAVIEAACGAPTAPPTSPAAAPPSLTVGPASSAASATALPALTHTPVMETTMMPQPTPQPEPTERAQATPQSEDDRLPAGALISYENISLGKGVRGNVRWILYQDGRWYLGTNSPDYAGQRGRFESDLPSTPTRVLPASVVREVEEQLRAGGFMTLESERHDPTTQDGGQVTIIARLDGQIHEVTDYTGYSQLLSYLAGFASRNGPTARR